MSKPSVVGQLTRGCSNDKGVFYDSQEVLYFLYYTLMPRLHQDTCRPETCIPDEQLVSGHMSTDVDGYKLLARDTYRLYLGDIILLFIYVTVDLYIPSNPATATSGYNLYPATCVLV